MQGQLLGFSPQENIGYISGDDGKRYQFSGTEWKESVLPQKGERIDFDLNESGQAISVFRGLDLKGMNAGKMRFSELNQQSHSSYLKQLQREKNYGFFEWFEKSMENYTNILGRAGLKEFWYFHLCSLFFIIIYGIVIYIGYFWFDPLLKYLGFLDEEFTIVSGSLESNTLQVFIIISILGTMGMIFLLPTFAVTVRRLHDVGKSAGFMMFYFTGIGAIPVFILCSMKTKYQDNQWGRPSSLPENPF